MCGNLKEPYLVNYFLFNKTVRTTLLSATFNAAAVNYDCVLENIFVHYYYFRIFVLLSWTAHKLLAAFDGFIVKWKQNTNKCRLFAGIQYFPNIFLCIKIKVVYNLTTKNIMYYVLEDIKSDITHNADSHVIHLHCMIVTLYLLL